MVFSCYDHKDKMNVAIKVIQNDAKSHKYSKTEIKILNHLNKADPDDKRNIIWLIGNFKYRQNHHLVFELMSVDLYHYMKLNDLKPCAKQFYSRIGIQLFVSLLFLKKMNVIHCDLKPENIMLKSKSKSGIKLIDFGSACMISEDRFTYI